MKTIGDHIDLMNASQSSQEAFDCMTKIAHGYGYDMVSYGCATDCPSLGLKKRHGHISNFPLEWLKYYSTNNLAEVDPVHIYAVQTRTPAYWSRCEQNASPESIQLMRDAADVGLKSGIIIPICDVGSEVSMVSLARSENASEETFKSLADLGLLGIYFYERYKSFIKKPQQAQLSAREYEILNWAAEGKTDQEIASITNISVATVRYHWKNIFKKLDVYNRVYAVSRAVQSQLIVPRYIMKNKK